MKSVWWFLELSTFGTLWSIKTSAGLIFNLLNFDIIFAVVSLYIGHANVVLPLWMRTWRLTNHHRLTLALCRTTEILQRRVFDVTQMRHLCCWHNVKATIVAHLNNSWMSSKNAVLKCLVMIFCIISRCIFITTIIWEFNWILLLDYEPLIHYNLCFILHKLL